MLPHEAAAAVDCGEKTATQAELSGASLPIRYNEAAVKSVGIVELLQT